MRTPLEHEIVTHKRAIYPGTFDPITNGHTDLVSRAADMFGHLTVAVARSAGKGPMFSLEERVGLTREVLAGHDNIDVVGFDGLLVHCMHEFGCTAVVRGIRSVTDFEYEAQLASMNRRLDPNIDTIFLTASDEHASISSSLVREIARLKGDVAQFVGPAVYAAINAKLKSNS